MKETPQLSSFEQNEIRQKLTYVLTDKNFHLLKNAASVSLVTALLPVWAFYKLVDRELLFGWLAAMTIVHLACIALVIYYDYRHPSLNQIGPWKNVARTAVLISTAMWGSMGVLLVPDTAVGQNFVLFFLIIISASVALGTSVDFLTSTIGIASSLLPFIYWQMNHGILHHSNIHIFSGAVLILYLLFLNIVSYVSYQLMKKSVELSFTNIALANKLADTNSQLKDLNSELEDRVAMRTKELNSALVTVTYQATHDILTTLPNENWLLPYVTTLITKAKEGNFTFALACLSINNMENITDRYGYYANDTIIKEVGDRLVKILENAAHPTTYKITIARSDVFVILIEKLVSEEIKQIIEPVFAAFKNPFEILHNSVFEKEQLYVSIGISAYPKDGVSADDLLMKADSTMFYIKKQNEHNYEHQFEPYNKQIAENVQHNVQLRKSMQVAINTDEFYLCYQPLVDIKTGLITSTEALIRWTHPAEGPVSPAKIIKVAEDYNLIIPLGEWVLRKACAQNYLWYKLGLKNIVSVNLSAKQLERGDIVKTITQILKDTGLQPSLLDLELTETEAFKDNVVSVINNLRDLGVSLTIDDYGQGFSNLSNLKKFSFNKIKIDMEFIKNLPQDVNSQIIVTSSIKMAKALGIKVVAEGVERQEQYDFLAKQGCNLIQGFLFYKPILAEELTEILLKQQHLAGHQ
ncbi:MAG: bifunctional diguanylate cyclase/phosphodiesterase [Pseudomonadota bacterium]